MPVKLTDIVFSHYIKPPFKYSENWQYVYNMDVKEGYFYYFFLQDTIHYKTLQTNDFALYKEYLTHQPYVDDAEDVEKRTANFIDLCQNFDIEKCGKFILYRHYDKYTIHDGLHRLAVMLHKGIIKDEIPDEFIITRQQQIENELVKTVGNVMYNDWHASRTKYGYHSFDICNIHIRGQRDCMARLNEFRKHFDFRDKNVLDFGCNVGGMLFHLHEIKAGLGIDYDEKVIDCAINISRILGNYKNHFIQHDFDKDDKSKLLKNKVFKKFKPDVIFLLSLQAWVKNWDIFYQTLMKFKCPVFIEGSPDERLFKKNPMTIIPVMANSYDDITGNYGRKTFLLIP